MSERNIKELLEEREKLNNEIILLHQKLREANDSLNAIKSGKIDALVIKEKELKIYSDNTADKPYRILIENMHEGAVTLNEDGTILYCNSYFADMLKLKMQKIIGTDFIDYIDNLSKQGFPNLIHKGLRNNIKEEIYIQSGDDKEIPVLMSLKALHIDNRVVMSIILTDLTIFNKNQEELKHRTNQLSEKYKELEKSNTELSIANAEVKELIGLNTHKENIIITLSHDLRSPLAGIIGLVDLLKEKLETFKNEEIMEILDLIYNSSTKELNMLDYLLEWGRIKYASEAFSPARIKLTQYVEKVFNILNDNAIAKNIELHNIIAGEIIVYADGKMLLSILQNLISNSLKHTPQGGKIIVSAKRNEDKYIIEVRDNGTGMSNEIKEKLFDLNVNELSKARKDKKGAGIGLLLVKSFVEKNGGEIFVDTVEGEGSSFYFTLPFNKDTDNNLPL